MNSLTCLKCGKKDIRKRGYRFNKVGKKQKYQCFNCKKWFVIDNGFKRMRHNKKHIVRAIHLHNEGLSLFQVKDHLWQHDGIKVTRKTISDWTQKYFDFF